MHDEFLRGLAQQAMHRYLHVGHPLLAVHVHCHCHVLVHHGLQNGRQVCIIYFLGMQPVFLFPAVYMAEHCACCHIAADWPLPLSCSRFECVTCRCMMQS